MLIKKCLVGRLDRKEQIGLTRLFSAGIFGTTYSGFNPVPNPD
ncbi:MAG: hypothetical protein ACE5EA_10945 [Nitrospirota bacterium]